MNLYSLSKDSLPQKTIRVLVYPNITFAKNLEKDSFIQVLNNQIRLLNTIEGRYHFTVLLPESVGSLSSYDNVDILPWKLPTYPPTMRSHFDVFQFSEYLSMDRDFDLVFSHLPEHTHQVKSCLYNNSHHRIPIIGYCHWFDFDFIQTWPVGSFNQNMLGLLEMDRCYLNTEFQKQQVLQQAKHTFNQKTVDKLASILQVQHLGVNEEDIIDKPHTDYEKVIVFNHRPDPYKHFDQFMALMDELRKSRQDFTVWIPLLAKANRDWVSVKKFPKKRYYQELQRCCVGFSPKQTYGGWSVSTTDGLMNGCPFILYDSLYYRELWPRGDFFKNDKEALYLLNRYLDDTDHRNQMATLGLKDLQQNLIYRTEIEKMNEYIISLLKDQPRVKNSQHVDNITAAIKQEKVITKQQIMDKLQWGKSFAWSPYRRKLLDNPNIFDVDSKDSQYVYDE